MAKKQMKDPDQVCGDGAAPDTAAPATAPPIISDRTHGSVLAPSLEQQIGVALDGAAAPAEALAALIAECEATSPLPIPKRKAKKPASSTRR